MGAKEARGPRRVRLEPERIERPILVLGAGGLVGSYVRAALHGRPVVATYRRAPPPDGVQLDVTDEPALRRVMRQARPAAVVLAAAEAHVERCEREPEATRRVNLDAARVVVEEAREVGATVVAFSSEYVLDGAAGPYREEDPPRPINEYGRQKVELERLARQAERHLICRTSGVFGWEPTGKNFVCQLLRRLRDGQEFHVPSDQVITPTYAPELARAVSELVEGGQVGTFHVVGPRVLSRVEFARLVARVFGLPEDRIHPTPTAALGMVAPRPSNAGLHDTKLRATLGRALANPAEALRHMVRTEPTGDRTR